MFIRRLAGRQGNFSGEPLAASGSDSPSPYQSHNEVPGFGVIKNPLRLSCSLSIAFDGDPVTV